MAQDIVQETFLKAWTKGGFRHDSEKAWLIKVAMNLCHDYHRSRWWKHIDHKASIEEIQIAEPDPADREILALVKELPFRERQIVILHFWNRMTLGDIAQTLGVSQSSVFRGLEKARTFGAPTAGYASANSPFPMPDGSQLVLTISCDMARTGEIFCDDPIEPDVPTDHPLEEALTWLQR